MNKQQIEDLARAVVCPICQAAPRRPCRYDWLPQFAPKTQWYSHLGRLKAARGESL